MTGEVVSFDAIKASRYILNAILAFGNDPVDSEFTAGYLAALIDVYRDGLGHDDDRVTLIAKTVYPDFSEPKFSRAEEFAFSCAMSILDDPEVWR